MSFFVDRKFISLVSVKLERFTQKSETLWNFRCPFCGDSKKNKLKARGYFYRKKANVAYACHNCHTSVSLGNFLKSVDPSLYSQYLIEKYKEASHSNVPKPNYDAFKTKPEFIPKPVDLPTVASLPDDHLAKQYLKSRMLPEKWYDYLYYAEDFGAFAKEHFSRSSSIKLVQNDKRIVIPFFDEKKTLQGVQGRTLVNSKIRYITLKAFDDAKKIFGLDLVDFQKTIYVVEGPLDSMFLSNCIATMDSNLSSVVNTVGKHDYVFVFDNEPRNKEVIREMNRVIQNGHKIVIWPATVVGKDINEMVQNKVDVNWFIQNNTYEGLKAQLELTMWKKV